MITIVATALIAFPPSKNVDLPTAAYFWSISSFVGVVSLVIVCFKARTKLSRIAIGATAVVVGISVAGTVIRDIFYYLSTGHHIITIVQDLYGVIFLILIVVLMIMILHCVLTKNLLFGEKCFTHRQLAFAYKKRKKGEVFTEDELPEAKRLSAKASDILSGIVIFFLFFCIAWGIARLSGAEFTRFKKEKVERQEKVKDTPATADKSTQQTTARTLTEFEIIGKINEANSLLISQSADDHKRAFDQFVSIESQDKSGLAAFGIANCYFLGRGVEKNMQQAFKWYKKVADKNLPEVWAILSGFYAGRCGNDFIDYEKAFFYAKKASDAGIPLGHTGLAVCYEKGFGCKPDQGKAIELYKRAARAGEPNAQNILKARNISW